MPVQQQMSSFAKKLGGRVAQANAEHADKPVDTGNRRLPAGIRDGVAKLSTMYTKEYEDDKNGTKGQIFFRASAVVVIPTEHNGEKTYGQITSVMVPLCDVPAKGMRKASTFNDNWFEFQNIFKLLGVASCPETSATDPTGQRTEAYFFAAMKTLTDPIRAKTNPVFISFSTRGWTPPTPPPTAADPNPKRPDEMVFETWHGLADPAKFNAAVDPAAGVDESPAAHQPAPNAPPPSPSPRDQAKNRIQQANQERYGSPSPTPSPSPQTSAQGGAAQPPTYDRNGGPGPQYQPDDNLPPADITDLVAALVETAMDDPEGATDDGSLASGQLEEMAWKAGWTKEQTAGAADWAAVGDMALNPPPTPTQAPAALVPAVPTPTVPPVGAVVLPTVGSKWMFAKRSKEGGKLRNNKGEEFSAQEVEVVTIDPSAKTCTVKTTRDGKDVVDIRTKKPVAVQFDWLEIMF